MYWQSQSARLSQRLAKSEVAAPGSGQNVDDVLIRKIVVAQDKDVVVERETRPVLYVSAMVPSHVAASAPRQSR